jgi:hypothetical protein
MKPLYTTLISTCLLATATLLSGCSDDNDDGGAGGGGGDDSTDQGDGDTDEDTLTWAGATPHLELEGNVGGEALDLSLEAADAADLGTLYCERNYIVPSVDDESTWGDGYLEKVEVKLNFFSGDKIAELQIELEAEDLPSLVGQTLTIGDDAEATPQVTLDPDGPAEEELEDVAVSGTVKLELLSGTPGDDGLIVPDETGAFGAVVDLVLESGETLRGTFTASCGENDLEAAE